MRIVLILLFVLCSNMVLGQFWIGPKIGIQGYTTTFKFSEARDDYKSYPRMGFTIGGAISANLKPTFSITGEFQYSLKGKHTEIRENEWRNVATFHYLEGPIMLRYIFEEFYYQEVTFRPYIQGGPNFMYWLGGKGNIRNEESSGVFYKISFDEADTVNFSKMSIGGANRFMWGLELGGGVIVNVKQGQIILIDLRFHFGHTFFGDKDGAKYPMLGFSDNLEQHYRLLNLSATYLFEVDLRKMRKGKSTINKRKRR